MLKDNANNPQQEQRRFDQQSEIEIIIEIDYWQSNICRGRIGVRTIRVESCGYAGRIVPVSEREAYAVQ